MRVLIAVVSAIWLATSSCCACAGELRGSARIIDGDTIEVAGTRIRLEGIDAPERGQDCQDRLQQPYDCGATAVRTLVNLTNGKPVTCEPIGEDRFGRVLAVCRLPSGLDINAELVRQGRAVAFRRYSTRYITQEDQARRSGAGLWGGTFQHPGCWRAQRRSHHCKDTLPTTP